MKQAIHKKIAVTIQFRLRLTVNSNYILQRAHKLWLFIRLSVVILFAVTSQPALAKSAPESTASEPTALELIAAEAITSESTATNTLPEQQWQVQSVHELLQADLQQALQQTRKTAANGAVMTNAMPLLAPKLVALYGVGKALMAEVQVGSRAYLYVRGQPYPAGYQNDGSVYQLRAMNGACVQLEKEQDKHSLCLRMLLGEQQQ